MINSTVPSSVISDMKSYYEDRAAEYDEWFYREGRYDHGRDLNERWMAEAAIVKSALDSFRLQGTILELAPGTGIWTGQLLNHAASITAVDASPQMLAINASKVSSSKVRYIEADLFEWQPDKAYDAVFFGFWLSHVPADRFDNFLKMVESALKPDAKIFFVDSRPEQTMSAKEHKLPAPGSQVMKRVLNDGRTYDIIKRFYEPKALESKFSDFGMDVSVKETPSYFLYGMGQRKVTRSA